MSAIGRKIDQSSAEGFGGLIIGLVCIGVLAMFAMTAFLHMLNRDDRIARWEHEERLTCIQHHVAPLECRAIIRGVR